MYQKYVWHLCLLKMYLIDVKYIFDHIFWVELLLPWSQFKSTSTLDDMDKIEHTALYSCILHKVVLSLWVFCVALFNTSNNKGLIQRWIKCVPPVSCFFAVLNKSVWEHNASICWMLPKYQWNSMTDCVKQSHATYFGADIFLWSYFCSGLIFHESKQWGRNLSDVCTNPAMTPNDDGTSKKKISL